MLRRLIVKFISVASFAVYILAATNSLCGILVASKGQLPRPAEEAKKSGVGPFDKLELLAFSVASFSPQYAVAEIDERGIKFAPDAVLLSAVRSASSGSTILNAVEKARRHSSPNGDPKREAAYEALLVAVSKMRHGQRSSAEQDFQDALTLAPFSAPLHLAYAENLTLLKKWSAAEPQCRLSIQLWPDYADAHSLLASSLMGQNRDAEAIPEAREALRIFPNHKGALVMLGMALTRSRQYEEAVPVLLQAVERAPEVPALRKDLGVSFFHIGNIDGAADSLSSYLSSQPNDAEAHYYLGAALRAKGRQADAQAQFNEAERLDPSNPIYSGVAGTGDAEKPSETDALVPDAGSVSDNVYTNQFFGFSLELPKDWTTFSASEAGALERIGGAVMSGGDATLRDAMRAVSKKEFPLLYAVQSTNKDGVLTARSIQISALDRSVVGGDDSSEGYANGIAVLLRNRSGIPLQPEGDPAQIHAVGRSLWRLNLIIKQQQGEAREAMIVTRARGYMLMFTATAPDPATRDDVVKIIQTAHFSDDQE